MLYAKRNQPQNQECTDKGKIEVNHDALYNHTAPTVRKSMQKCIITKLQFYPFQIPF